MNTFSELSLCPALRANLEKHGFAKPTPVQAQAIPPALQNRDVVATAQTGTGKTLAFVLPLIESLQKNAPDRRKIQGLILTPTRELAIQIHETFAKLATGTGLRAAVVVGGLSEGQQLRAIRAGAQVVIATPGRLCDFLNRRLVDVSGVSVFTLDEADRMLDMGFLPSIRLIVNALPAERQTLFFSATIEKSVAHLIESHVRNPVRVEIGATAKTADRVDLKLYEIEPERKLDLLVSLLGSTAGTFLVFARTKHGTDRLAKQLKGAGVKAGSIHGGRTQSQRQQALDGFKRGDYRVLVATDVAARGIHVEAIAHVVNFDLPQIPEDFVHRVGRTGRAGSRGVATTFATRQERGDIRAIEREIGMKLAQVPVPADLPKAPKLSLPAEIAPKVIVIPAGRAKFVPRRQEQTRHRQSRPNQNKQGRAKRSAGR